MDRSNQGLRTEPFKKTVRIPWAVLSRHSLPKLHTIVRNIIPSGGEGLLEYGTTMDDQRVWDTDIDRLLNLAGAPTDFAVVGQHIDTEGCRFTIDLDLGRDSASCTITGHDKARVEGASVLLTRFFAQHRERTISTARWGAGVGSAVALGCAVVSLSFAPHWITGILVILGGLLLAGVFLLRPAAHVQIQEGDKPRTRAENIQLLGTAVACVGTLAAIARFVLELLR
ncbi:MAG TPA: hypothetical protein VK464_19560 [Symbiobacteriaceae bacterium]|jgi:hypothetical protein|nr:hypothetical protein [Symbiobacteriaceae bacterium]